MANTFTSLHYHITFSTKRRERWLAPNVEERIWEYLGGIAKTIGMQPHRVGGIEDHVHLVVSLPPTLSVSKGVQLLKGGASKWIHETFPTMSGFAWQDGYGAFSVSKSGIAGGDPVRGDTTRTSSPSVVSRGVPEFVDETWIGIR